MWKLITIEEKQLESISGGDSASISGPVLTALVNIIKLVQEAGYNLGSGIRRIAEDDVCPLR